MIDMRLFWKIYLFMERVFFNSLSKKITGNILPLIILQAAGFASFYFYVHNTNPSSKADTYLMFSAAVLVISALLAIFNIFFLRFLIIRPLASAKIFLDELCDSLSMTNEKKKLRTDISRKINVMTVDEIGDLFTSYNMLFGHLNDMFEKIQEIANSIFRVMVTLTDKSNNTFKNANEQATQSVSIATAVEEMSQTITDVAQNASNASETSITAEQNAREGQAVADNAIENINIMHQSTADLSVTIESLNTKAKDIESIVTVINDIADQTNLLALNAAIEAARAGEQGRGFAVVADEVRKLAERTIKATAEITGMVSSIQSEAVQTTESVTKATDESRKVYDYVDQIGSALISITDSVDAVKGQITQIATAVEEQSATAEEIASNAEGSSTLAKKTEDLSSGMLDSIESLRDASILLSRLTRGIRTTGHKDVSLEIGITDAMTTMSIFRAHVEDVKHIDVSRISDPTTSKLGRWIYAEGKEFFGHLPVYSSVISTHEEIHAIAAKSIKAKDEGNKSLALELLEQMDRKVDEMIELLKSMRGVVSSA